MEKDYLLKERPLRALLLFALPMIIGNLFQQFYTMADSMVVGRYVSENALAAVGASYSLTNVFICVAIGGGVGASVLTSQYFGAREYGRMKQSVSTALLTFLAVSLALAALGLAFGREFMVFLKTPEDILDMTVEYLNIYFMGLPFLFMYNVLSSMFNALGRSRIPLYLLIFSSIFNIVLDIYLVRSLGLGIAGVAWATLIAQGISAFLSFLIFLGELRGYPGADTKMESVRKFYSTEELFTMCRVALPSIFQQSTVSIGMMLVQSVVNSFGPQMLAGFSAGMRVEYLYCSHGRTGQCHVLLHCPESGRRTGRPRSKRLSRSSLPDSLFRLASLSGARAFPFSHYRLLLRKRRHNAGPGDRKQLFKIHWLFLCPYRP